MIARVHSILLASALCAASAACAQELKSVPDSTQAGKYAFVLYAGGGLSYLPTDPGTPHHLDTRVTTLGPSGTARLVWLADHRLRLAFETGWTTFYSYRILGPGATGRVQLVGVPLLVMWSMPLTRHLSLFAGYGTYRVTSKLDYEGTAFASTFSLGYAAALSYVHPLTERLGIALEVKWYNAAETRQTLLLAQTELVWKLHRW